MWATQAYVAGDTVTIRDEKLKRFDGQQITVSILLPEQKRMPPPASLRRQSVCTIILPVRHGHGKNCMNGLSSPQPSPKAATASTRRI